MKQELPSTGAAEMEKKKKPSSNLGRRGDPRMHRAVAARLANPELSLMDALAMGGFQFGASAGDDSTVVDADGVTLGQRKNQLSRRLRLSKQSLDSQDTENNNSNNNNKRQRRNSKRGSATLISPEAQAEYQKLMQHTSQSLASGNKLLKRNASALSASGDEAETTSGGGEDGDTADETSNAANRMAKFHPNYHPILMPQPHAAAAVAGTPWGTAVEQAAARGPTMWGVQPPQQAHSENGPNMAAATPAPLNFFAQGLTTMANSQQHQQPSGVAVASLRATAASAGMTLEQLAVSLSSTANLSAILRNQNDPESKQELALNLYKSENLGLYKRCMHLAGYSVEETDENHPAYLAFVTKAWQTEGNRLEHIHSLTDAVHNKDAGDVNDESAKSNGHSHSSSGCFDGRHVHRLEGKCGHKAIIHQPENGPAHVDFLVDGKVECYEGIKPVGSKATFWKSRFKCDQIACNDANTHQTATCGPENCEKGCEEVKKKDPKVFDLSDIDLDGKEWNPNFFDTNNGQIDETLLGLIRLGDNSED